MSKNQSTKEYLDCVSDDISQLRHDVASLFSHTGRHTIPDGARDIADYGRDRIHAGGEFAASQLRYMRAHPGQSSAGLLGGLILLGAVGAGIYYLCKSDCCKRVSNDDEEPDFERPHGDIELPPYIS